MRTYCFRLAFFFGIIFDGYQSFSQTKLMRVYYDEEEKNLKEEYQVDVGSLGWEKNGYYKSFYPSGRLAVEGNFRLNVRNGWFREFYDTLVNQKPILKSQVFYEDGKKKGLMCVFSLKGDTLQKAYFNDDQITGKVFMYYDNGKLLREGNFIEGQLEGVVREYYEDGKIFKELSFVKGKMHGIAKTFYPSGNLQYEEYYQNGLREGLQKEFYDAPSSPIMLEFTMKNNTKEGKEILYSIKGKILMESEYVSGQLHGSVKRWSEETGELIYEAIYKEGYRVGKEIEYYKDQKIAKMTIYSNQERNKKVITYTENGEVSFEAFYQNNLLNGLVKENKPNENFWTETLYKLGKKEGESKTYYKSSKKLKSKASYKNNLLDGEYTEYDENGKLKIKGQYKMGKKIGKWLFYNEDGKEHVENF